MPPFDLNVNITHGQFAGYAVYPHPPAPERPVAILPNETDARRLALELYPSGRTYHVVRVWCVVAFHTPADWPGAAAPPQTHTSLDEGDTE